MNSVIIGFFNVKENLNKIGRSTLLKTSELFQRNPKMFVEVIQKRNKKGNVRFNVRFKVTEKHQKNKTH